MIKVVERVDAAYPHLLRWNTGAACVEFCQRLCAEPELKAERFGLLSKHPPEHCYQLPNGAFVAVDVVVKPNGERFDVVKSGDDHPRPGGIDWRAIPPSDWRPSNVWIRDSDHWPIYDSGTPHQGEAMPALLGLSNFPLIRALKDYANETEPSLVLADRELEHDYERVFCDLEGLDHGDPDPWLYMGIDIRDPQWPGDFRRMMDALARRKKLAWLTLYGGRNHAQGQSQQQRNNDTLVAALESGPYWSMVTMGEVANEPKTNRWTYAELQAIGRDLARKVAGRCRLTLGSPEFAHTEPFATNEQMRADFEEFYNGIPGITDITVHLMRDLNSVWSDPFAFNFILPALPKLNGEDFGPGASAGGDLSDPVKLVNRYKRASAAGWTHHTVHPRWGIFHGRLPSPYSASFPEKRLADHANIVAILNAHRAYRHGASDMPLKPRDQFAKEFEEINRFYAEHAGLKRPGGMVIDTGGPDPADPTLQTIPADVVAMEQWGYDLMAGSSVEDIKRAITQSDEWKAKHPGETPPA